MIYRLRTTFKFLLGLVLTVILLFVAFRGTDLSSLWNTLKNLKPGWVLSAIPLLLLSHYIRAWRWQLLLVPVKDRIGRGNAFSSLIMGYMINNVLPRAGELFRPYALGKVENISKASTLGSVVLERLIDLLSLLIGLGILLLLFRGRLSDNFPWWENASIILGVLCFVLVAVLVLLLYRRNLVLRIMQFALYPFSETVKRKIVDVMHLFIDGMLVIRERKNIGAILLLSLAMWVSYIFMAYLPLLAFDISGTELNLLAGFVLTIVTSLSVLIPTPGATGAYHTFTVEALTRLYGLQREIALGYATVTHAAGYFSVIILGLYYFIRYNMRVRDVLSQSEADQEVPGAEELKDERDQVSRRQYEN